MRTSFTLLFLFVLAAGCSSASSPPAGSSGTSGTSGTSGGDGGSSSGSSGSSGAASPEPGTFGFKCSADAVCTNGTDTCVFSSSRGGSGFCSRPCEQPADCPSQYDCQTIGGAARKYCVPEDHLADCKSGCESFDFFKCLVSGALAKCETACESATVTVRKTFAGCSGSSVTCDANCLQNLSSDGASWVAPTVDCQRGSTFDQQCKGMGLPAKGYTCNQGKEPTQTGCQSLPLPDTYCCPT